MEYAMKETKKSSDITKEINRIAGASAFKVNDRYASGYSDIHGCCRGMAFYIEVKITDRLKDGGIILKHKFSPLQILFLTDMKEAGACAVGMIYSVKEKKWYYCEPENIDNKGQPKKIMEVGKVGNFIEKRVREFADNLSVSINSGAGR